jgi:hypothetical protein
VTRQRRRVCCFKVCVDMTFVHNAARALDGDTRTQSGKKKSLTKGCPLKRSRTLGPPNTTLTESSQTRRATTATRVRKNGATELSENTPHREDVNLICVNQANDTGGEMHGNASRHDDTNGHDGREETKENNMRGCTVPSQNLRTEKQPRSVFTC